MKILEDPYYHAHLRQTHSRLLPINLYLFIALMISGTLYVSGVLGWLFFSLVISGTISLKILSYFRILTAKRQLQKHHISIGFRGVK
jgi:hypothetical protein